MYKNPLGITSQFRFCGNPLRLDFYRGCNFGCNYCFANARQGNFSVIWDEANFKSIEKLFHNVFEQKTISNLTQELISQRCPIHIGGMSDPFQNREWEMGLNYKMITLSNLYQYPLIFSTKTDFLPERYYDILNPKLHAFQISLMGMNESFIRRYESHTPPPQNRINFLKKLREKNFWVSIRIQPLIDLNEAALLSKQINGIANYVTIEHLKIPADNKRIQSYFQKELSSGQYKRISNLRNYELNTDIKEQNINYLKTFLPDTSIGCGDNDLHWKSESRCCCGIDTIGDAFNNFPKYNLTYFSTGKAPEDFNLIPTPQKNIGSILNSDSVLYNKNDWKSYVDYYCHKNYRFMGKEDNQNFWKNKDCSELILKKTFMKKKND